MSVKLKDASKIETSQIEIQTQISENFSLCFIKGIQPTTHRLCWASQLSQFVGYEYNEWYVHMTFKFWF